MGFVQIPVDALSRQALDGLIEEFVTRDGTDYGTEERSLDDKKDAVRFVTIPNFAAISGSPAVTSSTSSSNLGVIAKRPPVSSGNC